MKSKSNKILIFTFIFLFEILSTIPISYADENMDISLSVDKTQISEGEEVTLSINLKRMNQSSNFNLSPVEITGLENFQITGSYSSNRISIINGRSQSMTTEQKVLLPRSKGEFTIGPAKATYIDPNTQQTKSIESNSVKITVSKKLITKNSSNPKSILSYNSENKSSSKLLYNLTSIIVVLILIGLIYLYFWQEKKKKEYIREERNNEMEIIFPEIEDENFIEKITLILRNHLKEEIGLNEISSTTSEILNTLEKKNYYKQTEVKNLLSEIDKSKFAKTNSNRNNLLNKLKEIIN